MSEKKMDELFEHEYDGIQEFDNDLPGWWIGLFILTIIFSFFYLVHFHVLGLGDSQTVKYEKSMNPEYVRLAEDQGRSLMSYIFPTYHSPYYSPTTDISQKQLFGDNAGADLVVEEELVDADIAAFVDADRIAGGKKTYDTFCFTCHGIKGEGGIGPNLTDDFWIHGGSFPEMVHTIRVGVPIKGMIAWKTQMPPDDIMEVASYIQTLQGTNPANAKAPQGELHVAETVVSDI